MRNLLKPAVYAVICAFLFCPSCTNTPQKGIGLQLYSLRDEVKKDPKQTIAEIGTMGYSYIEAYGYKDGNFFGMTPVEFKDLIEENNMSFLGSHAGRAISDSGNWEELMPWWDQCIKAHKEVGVEYIVQPFMGRTAYFSLEGLQQYCEYFNAVGEKCKKAGIIFGYHNHAREFETLEGEVIFDYMLSHTDPEYVMFQMDVYWVNEGGANPLDYFQEYPDRFGSIHIKDEKELGESGKIDFKPIMKKAKELKIPYQVVEVERYSTDPLESVKASLDFLRKEGWVK